MPFGSIYLSGWKVTIGSIYPLGSIYLLGWKYPLGPFTLQFPFTIRVGKYQQFHLPFGMEVPIGSIYPSGSVYSLGSVYPSGWKCLSSPFTLRVPFTLWVPFTFRDGSTHRVQLPISFHLPFGLESTLSSIYPSSWKVPTVPFTFRDGSIRQIH